MFVHTYITIRIASGWMKAVGRVSAVENWESLADIYTRASINSVLCDYPYIMGSRQYTQISSYAVKGQNGMDYVLNFEWHLWYCDIYASRSLLPVNLTNQILENCWHFFRSAIQTNNRYTRKKLARYVSHSGHLHLNVQKKKKDDKRWDIEKRRQKTIDNWKKIEDRRWTTEDKTWRTEGKRQKMKDKR